MEKYLTPAQVCEMVPGSTVGYLSQLRYRGIGPSFIKPSAKKVLYRESDIIAWLEANERTITGTAV